MDKALVYNLNVNLNLPEINNFFKDALATKRNPYQWIGWPEATSMTSTS